MERKGYYGELVKLFEGIRDKKEEADKEIRKELDLKQQTEEEIAAKVEELRALRKVMANTLRARAKNAKLLEELEGGGLRAELAFRKLKYAAVPVEERTAELREAFRDDALGAEPGSPLTNTKFASSLELNHTSVAVEDVSFEGANAEQVAVRCYSGAPGAAAAAPVLLFFHGEGYVMGDFDTHEWMCRTIAAMARVTVAAVDYRRAPEAIFPAAFDDAYRAVCWVAEGGLGQPPPSVSVAGDSNGAALALACCLKARDAQGPEIKVQILFYPWLDLRPDAPSMQAESDIAFLADLDWFRSVYAPPFEDPQESGEEGSEAPPQHPLVDGRPWFEDFRASPILAESLADLPPAFIVHADDDPLACDSLRLAERLRAEAGDEAVHTMFLEGPLGHGFAKRADHQQAHITIAAAAAFTSAAVRAHGHSPTKHSSVAVALEQEAPVEDFVADGADEGAFDESAGMQGASGDFDCEDM